MNYRFQPQRRRVAGAAILSIALLSACALTAPPPPTQYVNNVLSGPTGMTLYTFDKDAVAGKSVCNGPCATNWPPLLASDADRPSGDYTIIMRDDGRKQWALKGQPLYYWSKDNQPGDRSGDGYNKVWHVVPY